MNATTPSPAISIGAAPPAARRTKKFVPGAVVEPLRVNGLALHVRRADDETLNGTVDEFFINGRSGRCFGLAELRGAPGIWTLTCKGNQTNFLDTGFARSPRPTVVVRFRDSLRRLTGEAEWSFRMKLVSADHLGARAALARIQMWDATGEVRMATYAAETAPTWTGTIPELLAHTEKKFKWVGKRVPEFLRAE